MTSIDQIKSIPNEVYDALDELGVPQHLSGYKYLALAIKYVLDNPLCTKVPVWKVLYPHISEIFDTTPIRVERNIRHCMDALEDLPEDVFYKYFGNSIKSGCSVSNSKFIHSVANKIMMNSNKLD